MKFNIKHPSFISFMEMVTSNVCSSITLSNYFGLSSEKKLGVQYMVFKIIKKSLKIEPTITATISMTIVVINANGIVCF